MDRLSEAESSQPHKEVLQLYHKASETYAPHFKQKKGYDASIQLIFIKHLLCARHSSGCLPYIGEKIQDPSPAWEMVSAERELKSEA